MSADPPPLEYLFGCTDSELRRFVLHAMERAAILEKQRKELIEELLAARLNAEVAGIMLETRRLSATGHPIQKSLDLEGNALGEMEAQFSAAHGVRCNAAD